VIGVHYGSGAGLDIWNKEKPWDLFGPVPDDRQPSVHEALLAWQRRNASHVAVQVSDRQTLAFALARAPIG